MNAVEIEQAISDLALAPFDRDEFPYAFLQAFGNKATTIKRLRSGESNKSDVGGVLQTSNIHIATTDPGGVTEKLAALRASPATTRGKAKPILATDGVTFEAEELDHQGFLDDTTPVIAAPEDISDDELLAQLGVNTEADGITALRHVRSVAEECGAEEIVNRNPAPISTNSSCCSCRMPGWKQAISLFLAGRLSMSLKKEMNSPLPKVTRMPV